MRKFTYNRGAWEEGHSLPKKMENENKNDYLARMGYLTNSVSYGAKYGGRLEIFEKRENDVFFAFISPTGQTSFEVLIPDFPSYMLFIKDYGGSIAAAGTDATQKEIMETLAKLFRAEHGHHWDEVCHHCDPKGWERWNERQEKPLTA